MREKNDYYISGYIRYTMALFILQENQKLIWDTMNKVPQFHSLDASMPGGKERWFKDLIQTTYEKMQSRQLTVQELRQLNKETISSMISRLKNGENRLADKPNEYGINASSTTTPITDSSHILPMYEDKTSTRNYMLGQKQDVLNVEFANRQQEFESLMKRDPVKEIDFREQTGDDQPIENMEALLKKHIRDREYDVETATTANVSDKGLTKNVKWANEIESGPSNVYVDMKIFQEFVRKTNAELRELRNEIALLREENAPIRRQETTGLNSILSRLRRSNPRESSTSLAELEDVSGSFTV
jgi:hypothetical protein